MNIVDIHDVNPETRLISVDDTAIYLNLFYRELVEELLEVFTDFTDIDIIQEIVDIVKLPFTCVTSQAGLLVHGFITGGVHV